MKLKSLLCAATWLWVLNAHALPNGSNVDASLASVSEPGEMNNPRYGGVWKSCADAARKTGLIEDREWLIEVAGRAVTVYCHDVAHLPREYITLPQGNFSEYASVVDRERVRTEFHKVRLDLKRLLVDVTDLTFASTTRYGELLHDRIRVSKMPYAVAMGCDGNNQASATARINLAGTGFGVIDNFESQGFNAEGNVQISKSKEQVVLDGGGYCGWMAPGQVFNPYIAVGWQPSFANQGFALRLFVRPQ
jgi:GON domain